jgi:hypothetical protein
MTVLLVIAAVLFIFWAVGLSTRFTSSGLIHVALVIAVILLAIWLLRVVVRVF